MKKVGLLIGVMAVLFLCGTAHADRTIWYVHPDSTLNTIQAGLDSCADNDIVLVGSGTYIENIIWPNTQGIHLISELGPEATIIDGDSNGSVVGITIGVDSATLIRGFTIQNGHTDQGGGIFCGGNSSPSLTNVTISGNTAGHGGGIYCSNSSPRLENVTISGNTASGLYASSGGGIYCENSSPSLTNVTISGNTTGSPGGSRGGGIFCGGNSSPSLTNVTISGNTSNMLGGGIFCGNSSPSLENVTISGNTAGGGAGIFCSNSSPSLTNVTISGNTAGGGGGIYCSDNSSPSLTNVTISGNTATNAGGGIWCSNSSPSLVNCILWNDTPPEIYIVSGSATATYSDIQGGWPGTGNIDEDPVFVSGPLSDYHLSLNSPCIDAGNPDPQYNDPEDPLNPGYAMWPALGTVRNDMGVYGGPGTEGWVYIEEYKPPQPMSTILQISPNPFRSRVTINFSIDHSMEHIELKIYDATGRLVKEFGHTANQRFNQVIWTGDDNYGNKVPSGVYFLKLVTEDYSATEKLLLIR